MMGWTIDCMNQCFSMPTTVTVGCTRLGQAGFKISILYVEIGEIETEMPDQNKNTVNFYNSRQKRMIVC